MEYCLILAIICTLVVGGASFQCPSRCNTTGYLVDVVECGTLGFCCGAYLDPYCCTDYWERLDPAPQNATQQDCDDLVAALQAGHGTRLQPGALISGLCLGIFSLVLYAG